MWSFRKFIHKVNHVPDFGAAPVCDDGMDVAFIVDYNSNMGPIIEEFKASVSDIITTIDTLSNLNTYRLSLVLVDEVNDGDPVNYVGNATYIALPIAQKYVRITGPTTDQYLTALEVFSALDNGVAFTNTLNLINTGPFPIGSGINPPNPLDIALDRIINFDFVNAFRVNQAKYIVIFTNSLPSGDDDIYDASDDAEIASLTTDCINQGIKVIVVGSGASNTVWQNLANNTGGSWNVNYHGPVVSSAIISACTGLLPPEADAGADQVLFLPANSTVVDGSASFDPDGAIVTYLWEYESGPGGSTIVTPNNVSTSITGLVGGLYSFKLTVTDNDGLQDVDFISIAIFAPPAATIDEDDIVEGGNGTCTSCVTLTVNVPVGTTKRVEIYQLGDPAAYSSNLGLCAGVGDEITSDTIEVINATKTYKFGIDAFKQLPNSFSSSIRMDVYDDPLNNLDDTYILTRTHQNINC